jgi:hypothetical protein
VLFPGPRRPRAAGARARPPVVAAVLDSAGTVRGCAFLAGADVAVTSIEALQRAGATVRLTGRPEPIGILVVDEDHGLGVALVKLDRATDVAPCTFAYEEVDMVDRPVGVTTWSAGDEPTEHLDTVRSATARRSEDRTVGFLELRHRLAPETTGAPVVDPTTGAVIGVLRLAEHERTSLAVPFSEISRRWPVLEAVDPGRRASYDAIVAADLPEALVRTKWDRFDPARMHCVVVTCESAVDDPGTHRLDGLVEDVLASPTVMDSPQPDPGPPQGIWPAFRRAAGRQDLLDGRGHRSIPAGYTRSSVELATVGVLEAFDSAKSLELASRLIIEADLALFDVTGFEPGVMLLLGIRAATRRGVTIVSHGGTWREGDQLSRPFNLSDLSLASHTPSEELSGQDPRVEKLAKRITAGFDQLSLRPLYRDLPVFDAIRDLGASDDARRAIGLDQEILVLCSYDQRHYRNWLHLRSRLQRALARNDIAAKSIVRLQDIQDPQLVSLSLYDRIRRCTGCIADWTRSSASTFFELGVRIAASQSGVVQIVAMSWIAEVDQTGAAKRQFDLMLALFDPIRYGDQDETVGAAVAAGLVEIRSQPELQGSYGLRHVAAQALTRVGTILPDVVAQLSDEADALYHPNRSRTDAPQALYYEVPAIKRDQERASLERRLAAWLYLDRRVRAGDLPPEDPRRRDWVEIGQLAAGVLFDSPDAADQALAEEISEKIE